MKLIIDIPEQMYLNAKADTLCGADILVNAIKNGTPLPNGRLIDAKALEDAMYHEAFETDSDMQKWDSGCWIRYKMFENAINNTPTII